jgi:hypothetical protein
MEDIEVFERNLDKELSDLTGAYVRVFDDEVCLDGHFTAQNLRIIADKLDELNKVK